MKRRLLRALARHARLVAWLAILGWIVWIAGATVSGRSFRPGWLGVLFLIFVAASLLAAWVGSMQRMAIRESPLPVLPKRKLRQQFPTLEAKDADLVERGFRQFFMACSRSNGQFVAMPSKVVDAYWHALILDTRGYAEWCDRTLGRFLHHIPTERLGSDAKANDGLRRAWYYACKEEAIDPRRPSRLPLLFALDAKLRIAGGVVYSPAARPKGAAASADGGVEISYGDDFSDESFSGDAGAMGGADSGGDGDGGGCGGGD
ncbi:MAG: glycine-rich domain-containing protein [Caldimonas sp.]